MPKGTHLDGQSSLADTAVSEHHQLVQSHFTRHVDDYEGECCSEESSCTDNKAAPRRVRRICSWSISASGQVLQDDEIRRRQEIRAAWLIRHDQMQPERSRSGQELC